MFYAIAALASNRRVAVKRLCRPAEGQGWQVKTLLRQGVRRPAALVTHARRLVVRVVVPRGVVGGGNKGKRAGGRPPRWLPGS